MPSVNVHASQPELAKLFCSVRLVAPPMGDEVVVLVAHAFTPDEASVAIHIPFYRKKPVEMIAKKVGRPVSREQMREIVAERQEKNLVFMTGNIPPAKSNVICTCCDCCCHFIQMFRPESGRMSLVPPPPAPRRGRRGALHPLRSLQTSLM